MAKQEELNNPEEEVETSEQAEVSDQLKKIAEQFSNPEKQVKSPKPKKLSGFKKWLGVSVLGAASMAGTGGCESKKGTPPPPEKQKIENTDSGFTDNAHENVKRRVELKKAEWKFSKRMQAHKATPEEQGAARKAIEEMHGEK